MCQFFRDEQFSQDSSHKKKKLLLSIESWLFNRDPYNGLL